MPAISISLDSTRHPTPSLSSFPHPTPYSCFTGHNRKREEGRERGQARRERGRGTEQHCITNRLGRGRAKQ